MNLNQQHKDIEKQKLMTDASRFRDPADRRSFWTLIVIVIISTLSIAIFNFVL
ncbi:Uncharacterised protein [Klebsiella pneumoniae]|nr:hypothetical protein [Klebsiella oxytoca]STV50770.1 Uncharacterised protein [Klebsiella pneumoniae]SXS94901.1 Uncharacterised protein [Klebsiella pneumoniae]SXU27922.1 Uncharacterised protein [Klebsiella pneumoniae]